MSNYQHERGWLDSPVWGDAPYDERGAWSWMIGEAFYDDYEKEISGHKVLIKRGSFTSSLRFMAVKFKWDKNKVDRFLKKLVRWEMIKIGTAGGTGQNLITICNYNIYQNKRGKSGTDSGTERGQHGDSTGTAAGQTINPSIPSSPSNQTVDVPFFIDANVWQDWIAHRKEIKHPLKPTQSRAQIKKLTDWRDKGYDPNEIIRQSIVNGWQGLFEPKTNKPKGEKNGKSIADQTSELLDSIRQGDAGEVPSGYL